MCSSKSQRATRRQPWATCCAMRWSMLAMPHFECRVFVMLYKVEAPGFSRIDSALNTGGTAALPRADVMQSRARGQESCHRSCSVIARRSLRLPDRARAVRGCLCSILAVASSSVRRRASLSAHRTARVALVSPHLHLRVAGESHVAAGHAPGQPRTQSAGIVNEWFEASGQHDFAR